MRSTCPGQFSPASTLPSSWGSTPFGGCWPNAEPNPNPIVTPITAADPISIHVRYIIHLLSQVLEAFFSDARLSTLPAIAGIRLTIHTDQFGCYEYMPLNLFFIS